MINLDAFSHGQVKSKVWLCEQLEPYLKNNSNIAILGSWVNITGFMLLTRNPNKFSHVLGVDIDSKSVELANKVCSYWYVEGIQRSIVGDMNSINLDGINTIINCSSEHTESMQWFDNISSGTMVCIQSTDVTDINEPWLIKNPSISLEDFLSKYPLSETKFSGILPINYDTWGYNRFMVIGIK